jgi:hypothetical protein
MPELVTVCTTLETNRDYRSIMGLSLSIVDRVAFFQLMNDDKNMKRHITIEPIMDFDLHQFIYLIEHINPEQVNIGADSGNNHLPEPPKEKVLELITELEKFTKVHLKPNLNRIIG